MIALTGSYTKLPELLEHIDKKGMFSDIPRDIGWGALKSACKILDGVFDAFNQLLSLNFYEIPAIKSFVSTTAPIAWAAFGIAIVIAAIFLMINKDKLKISDFLRSILISAALIVALPFTINVLNDLKYAGVSDMQAQIIRNKTLGKTILGSITVDIEGSAKDSKVSTLLDSNTNSYTLNITDTLDKDDWGFEVKTRPLDMVSKKATTERELIESFFELSNAELMTYYSKTIDDQIIYFSENLKSRLANLKNNSQIYSCETLEEVCALYPQSLTPEFSVPFLSADYYDPLTSTQYYFQSLNDGYVSVPGDDIYIEMFDEAIYAYKYDFLMGLLLVIVTIVALFFAGFRVVGLLFDLVFNQIIAPIVFATDLQGSGRTKKMIENIVSTYLVFIIILVLVKIYLSINLWAIGQYTDLKDVFLKLFILVGSAKGLIDGPDIVVKLLGIDAGVKNGAAAMLGIQSAGRFAASAVGMGANVKNAPANIGKALYGKATTNPISNAQSFMRQSKLGREDLKANWAKFKSGGNSSSSSGNSDTAQPMSGTTPSSSSSSSDTTANPRT